MSSSRQRFAVLSYVRRHNSMLGSGDTLHLNAFKKKSYRKKKPSKPYACRIHKKPASATVHKKPAMTKTRILKKRPACSV